MSAIAAAKRTLAIISGKRGAKAASKIEPNKAAAPVAISNFIVKIVKPTAKINKAATTVVTKN